MTITSMSQLTRPAKPKAIYPDPRLALVSRELFELQLEHQRLERKLAQQEHEKRLSMRRR